jgi:hypothetical protein
LSEDKTREKGFEIFQKGFIRRLSSTHYIAKNLPGDSWYLIELKDGKWSCDCKSELQPCEHLYAAYLQRTTSRLPPEPVDETNLKCRYCGSPDLRGCGFRYNAHGIAKRYYCNDCQRKFSLRYIKKTSQQAPSELTWVLDELGMLVSKLNDLLSQLNLKLSVG